MKLKGLKNASGCMCLLIVGALFSFIGWRMGAANMLNTVMHTAHDLLLNTCFYLMSICVITGAIGKLFVEFRVVDLFEKVNGMYKVVTTETEIEDAFEDFDLDMDMDILSDNGENDNITRAINSNARRMRGEPDSVSIDWTMYNMITKGYKIKNINGVATRALEDEYEEDIDQDNTKSKEEAIITLDESSALGRLVINKYSAKVVNKFFLGLYSVTETHIKKQVQLKKKREYTDITNTNGLKLSYVIGRDFINPPNGETQIKQATAQL